MDRKTARAILQSTGAELWEGGKDYNQGEQGPEFVLRNSHLGTNYGVNLASGEAEEVLPPWAERIQLGLIWGLEGFQEWSGVAQWEWILLTEASSEKIRFELEQVGLTPHIKETNGGQVVLLNPEEAAQLVNRFGKSERGKANYESETYTGLEYENENSGKSSIDEDNGKERQKEYKVKTSNSKIQKTTRWVIFADLLYLASPLLAFFSDRFWGFGLLGLMGIVTILISFLRNGVGGYSLPAWWWIPAIAFPWSTYFRVSETDWLMEKGNRLSFKAGATLILIILAGFFVSGGFSPILYPVNTIFVEHGEDYIDSVQVKTAVSFGIARGLNSVLSVLESIEGGAGVASADIGAALEPLDDLIERFSWVMLASLATMTAIQILGDFGQIVGLSGLMPLGLSLLVLHIWVKNKEEWLNWLGIRFIAIGLVLFFIVPVMGFAVMAADYAVLEKIGNQAQEKVEPYSQNKSVETKSEEGWIGWVTGGASKILDKVSDYNKQMNKFMEERDKIVEGVVTILVVFIIRNMVIPLLVLWGSVRFTRCILGNPYFVQDWEHAFKERMTRPLSKREELEGEQPGSQLGDTKTSA